MKKWGIFLGVLFLVVGLNQLLVSLNFFSAHRNRNIAVPIPIATNSALPSPLNFEQAQVRRVIDGDTIELTDRRRVRYIGINSPEAVDPRKPVECFGKEARQANKNLVEGKTVLLEKDITQTDKYGRLTRYVYLGDKMVNEELVRNGFARADSYYPDIKYKEKLKEAEKEARENKRGLWAACVLTH